jgi:DNA-binding NtrC family response regulator
MKQDIIKKMLELPILVIDDSDTHLKAMELGLLSFGFATIILCADSRKAAEIIKMRRISLILLDLDMPFVSGKEIITLVEHEYPHIPIIIISGLDLTEKLKAYCIGHRIHAFFSKPVDMERFFVVITQILGQNLSKEKPWDVFRVYPSK